MGGISPAQEWLWDELVYLFTSLTRDLSYFRPYAYESTVQSERKTAVSKSESIKVLSALRRRFRRHLLHQDAK